MLQFILLHERTNGIVRACSAQKVCQGQPGQDEGVLSHLLGAHLPPPEGQAGQEGAHPGGEPRRGAEDAAEVWRSVFLFLQIYMQRKSRCFPGTFSRCLAAPDFKEGIRCHLLGKDKGLKPLWNPATLKQVKLVEEFVVESFD